MSKERQPDTKRGEISFIFAIVMGLALGLLIKKVRLGILLGLILGSVIVLLCWLRTSRK